MALDAEWRYADCHLCGVAFMLSVASKFYMLSVVMLSVVMMNVVAPARVLHYTMLKKLTREKHSSLLGPKKMKCCECCP
jgi:hypothetical protein